MFQYIVKRLLLMIPTLFGITLITFSIIRLAPGDPVAAKFGVAGSGMAASEGASNSEEEREKQIIRAKMRLGLMEEKGTIRFWDPTSSTPGRILTAHTGEVRALAYSQDGRLFASASSKGEVIVWDAGTGKRINAVVPLTAGINALAFNVEGNRLFAACDDRSVYCWSLTSLPAEPALEKTLHGHGGAVLALAISPDGRHLASGSKDKTVRLWSVDDQKEIARLEKHYQEVTALLFSRDGTQIVSASRDRAILVWDVTTRTLLEELPSPGSAILCLAFDSHSRQLAAGLANNSIALFDTATRQRLATLSAHSGAVRVVSFHPDGKQLLSGSKDKSIIIWNLAERRPHSSLIGHGGDVLAALYSPAGDRIASAAVDIRKIPMLRAYLDWVSRLVRFDFGYSFKDSRPVRTKLAEAVPVSIKLNLIVLILTYLLALPIGIIAAAKRGGRFDNISSVGVFLLYSMPSFWVATMLIIAAGSPNGLFANYLGFTLPFVGLHAENAGQFTYLNYLWDHLLHLLLPVTAFAYASFAFLSRIVRTSMLDVLSLDYVRTARAKGLSNTRVIGVHAFRNSLIPVVTLFGNLLPALIGGSVIIENIYNIPGMGQLSFDAIVQRDYPVIMGTTTCAAVLTMVGILISDIVYCIVDPRIELK